MIRKLMAASLTSIAVMSLGACAFSEGVKPDANITTSFTKGVSTESDVDARLGQPMKSLINPDGTRTVTYHYGEAHLGALAFVGAGGATGQDIITVVNFDRNGKFVSITQETDNRKTAGF
jgi:hypothetical protein